MSSPLAAVSFSAKLALATTNWRVIKPWAPPFAIENAGLPPPPTPYQKSARQRETHAGGYFALAARPHIVEGVRRVAMGGSVPCGRCVEGPQVRKVFQGCQHPPDRLFGHETTEKGLKTVFRRITVCVATTTIESSAVRVHRCTSPCKNNHNREQGSTAPIVTVIHIRWCSAQREHATGHGVTTLHPLVNIRACYP